MRSKDFLEFARRQWGDYSITPKERALRFLEEAIELAQAAGIDVLMANAVVCRVYQRPAGNVEREYNQAALLLEAYGEAAHGYSPSDGAAMEWDRIQDIPDAEWQRRHEAKRAQGILSEEDKP